MALKFFISLMLLFSGFVTIAQDDATCIPATGAPIQIGAIYPQRTLLTITIEEPYLGTQALTEAINACGGVDGRPVELVYEPANDRESAAAAAETLIGQGIEIILGSGSQAVMEALAEIADQKEVILWETTEAFSTSHEWAFTARPTHRQLGSAAATFTEEVVLPELGLETLRVALIYEDRQRGTNIAEGILAELDTPPLIEISYSYDLSGIYDIAERIRDEDINVVLLGTLDDDTSWLWYAMREENANIAAWIHIGSAGSRRDYCSVYNNYDGFTSVSPVGDVSDDYLADYAGIYPAFRQSYTRLNSDLPSERAILSAAGTYMLLRHVLPNVEGDFTAENVRAAILSLQLAEPSGLLGEGFAITGEQNINQYPNVLIQQRQNGRFCTSWPGGIATCGTPITPFPTWRERQLSSENSTCNDPA